MRARILELHYRTRQKLQQFRKEADQEGEYRVARRIHAVLLNGEGKTSGEISVILDSPRSKVSHWIGLYEEHGFDALLEGQRSGRPALLQDLDKLLLADMIESGPRACGFLSGVWSTLMIQKVVEEEFEVKYHPRHIRRILWELGFSVQRPKRVLAKADPLKQNRWRRYIYPNLKKSPHGGISNYL